MNDREDRHRCRGRLPGCVGLEDPHILEMAKRKERDEAPFHRWADEVHQRPGQKEKLRQAKEEDISVHFESEKKCFARMKAPDDQEEVWCGLGMCQCGTFKADHLPCKHIYKLALIRGMIE